MTEFTQISEGSYSVAHLCLRHPERPARMLWAVDQTSLHNLLLTSQLHSVSASPAIGWYQTNWLTTDAMCAIKFLCRSSPAENPVWKQCRLTPFRKTLVSSP